MTLFDLDIIGFASVIEEPTLPRVLAPVFRNRNHPERVVLPPFSVIGDEIFNFRVSTLGEFEALVAQAKLTPLSEPVLAKVNHDLWVNPDGEVAYSPKRDINRTFKELFRVHLAEAEEKLKSGAFESARQHSAIARAVSPSHLEPLIVRATAERLLGLTQQFAFTRHIASDLVSPVDFDRLVQARTGGMVATLHGAAVMSNMATRKPRHLVAA